MNNDQLDKVLDKITYKTGLLTYLIKICKKGLSPPLNADEFSGFLCSGVVPFFITWIEKEIIQEREEFSLTDLEISKDKIDEYISNYIM